MYNLLKDLTENVENIQEHTGNINWQIEILREDQKEMLKKKYKKINVKEMKSVFDGFTNGMSMSEKRINGVEDMSMGTRQT